MLKYLVILLDATSTSFCHYENSKKEPALIDLDNLQKGIFFAMKENLMIQFVYPQYTLPEAYKKVINSIDHTNIVPAGCEDKALAGTADVIVVNNWEETAILSWNANDTYVLRFTKSELFTHHKDVGDIVGRVKRLNIAITDIETFTEGDFDTYKNVLATLAEIIEALYIKGRSPQLNLLTDRMMLKQMNNCNAGWENITLAPDGKFYVCPAFYLAAPINGTETSIGGICHHGFNIGELSQGVDIKNGTLYHIDKAPLCRICDAYQCRRCIWLNRETTYEINTPSREQCVMAHRERNASRQLQANIRQHREFLSNMPEIKEIDYLDPFEIRGQW